MTGLVVHADLLALALILAICGFGLLAGIVLVVALVQTASSMADQIKTLEQGKR